MVKVLSYNIHKGIGWGVRKSTLSKIYVRLRELHPDIILLQESRGNQFAELAEEIWPHTSYGKNAVYKKGHHGNAVLSKFPIIGSENIDISMHRFERRGLLHTVVKLNNNKKLHICCVHLGLFKNDRRLQLDKIVSFIETHIPKNHPIILGGDFNDWRSYATIPLIHQTGLQEAFLASRHHYAKTFPAWAPMLRLDRLYFRGFEVKHAHRLTKMSWRPLSDHLALAVDLQPLFEKNAF